MEITKGLFNLVAGKQGTKPALSSEPSVDVDLQATPPQFQPTLRFVKTHSNAL